MTKASDVERVDVLGYNRKAWDHAVATEDRWTLPVGSRVIAEAREGRWSVVLTPTRPVPREWFPQLAGADCLALASAGGQQAPILAAAGARVTVFDNSPKQLDQDRLVARRDDLELQFEQGDMADLSRFDDESFDLIFHPVSNCFVPDIRPVWQEAFRVLRPGGLLLSGFANPILYAFDEEYADKGVFIVRHKIPFSDVESGAAPERMAAQEPLEFGHSLEAQIGGQMEAGFVLRGLYEDSWEASRPLAQYMPTFLATCALKPLV